MGAFLTVLFLIICILLILVVLLQKGRGGGLGAAFGGGGAGSAFGTRTGDVFTWVTIVLTALFLLLAIGSTLLYRPELQPVDIPVAKVVTQIPDQPSVTTRESGEIEVAREGARVSLQNMTQGASAYYTLDGSEPSRTSRKYSETSIPVEPGTVLKAFSVRAGLPSSRVLTLTFVRQRAAAPSISPETGPVTEATKVTITVPDGVTVRYTTDGSEPTATSDVYQAGQELVVEPGTTVRARSFSAAGADLAPSDIVEARYPRKSEPTTSEPALTNPGDSELTPDSSGPPAPDSTPEQPPAPVEE